jgi:predicted transcriptional regulator
VNHEVELLDAKAAQAKERAAIKRAEGDALRETIYNLLSDEEFKTINDIAKMLDDPDISSQMIATRLAQLSEAGMITKEMVIVPAVKEGGKNKRLTAYKRIG